MISDTEVAKWVGKLYAPQPGDFDQTVQVNPKAPFVGVKRLDDCDLVICRGSITADDWIRNFESELGRQVNEYPRLGLLPYGFAEYLSETYAALNNGHPVIFAGHSLGAAECQQLAGIHVLSGFPVQKVVSFAPPRPGTSVLTNLLAAVDVHLYRNAGDPVPDVPVPMPPFLSWEHTRNFRDIAETAGSGPLGAHHFPLYAAGAAAWEAGNP